jgi:L-seryl-tRNA(Ser) seleniumtransferase
MSHRRAFLQRLAALPLFARKPSINAAGTYTTLTASLMPPEVVQAIEYASHNYVPLIELQDKVGERIASLIGCEAAMVTAGAASALTCGIRKPSSSCPISPVSSRK